MVLHRTEETSMTLCIRDDFPYYIIASLYTGKFVCSLGRSRFSSDPTTIHLSMYLHQPLELNLVSLLWVKKDEGLFFWRKYWFFHPTYRITLACPSVRAWTCCCIKWLIRMSIAQKSTGGASKFFFHEMTGLQTVLPFNTLINTQTKVM